MSNEETVERKGICGLYQSKRGSYYHVFAPVDVYGMDQGGSSLKPSEGFLAVCLTTGELLVTSEERIRDRLTPVDRPTDKRVIRKFMKYAPDITVPVELFVELLAELARPERAQEAEQLRLERDMYEAYFRAYECNARFRASETGYAEWYVLSSASREANKVHWEEGQKFLLKGQALKQQLEAVKASLRTEEKEAKCEKCAKYEKKGEV